MHVNAAGRIGKENKHITILEIAEQLINFMLLAEITAAKRYKMIPRTDCRDEKVRYKTHIEVTLHNTMEINKINFENKLIE